MSAGLVLAEDLTLPLEAVTETLVLLGKRGASKIATASVLVEELLGARLPVCVIASAGLPRLSPFPGNAANPGASTQAATLGSSRCQQHNTEPRAGHE